ncbi:glycosyltransferase family 4 protein [uncultured Thermanaerothrix sp.]|uniref:glycosyltransferase family 4 protein n=1 Tax=uncultured Thermanaerothrix sp. TaxID=1195149 RepID=UPI00262C8DBB|nr:glycosyltransferase family 4 protein [uncultured Thermanaerothrix sp.]
MASHGKVLIIVQNLPVPFDRRVWLEATALIAAGYEVSVICPKGKHGDFQESHQVLEGVHIFRYPAPPEAKSVWGYFIEFIYCWLMTAFLSLHVWRTRGFDVIHACNPPETYFLLGLLYKIFGKKFVFDHHDLSPEMYVAKGGRKGGILYRLLLLLERLTFQTADVVLATNESHKRIAINRGGVLPNRIFVVRSGPDLKRLQRLPPEPQLKHGRRYLACYLGEMCPQDGVDLLLRAIKYLVEHIGRQDTTFVLMGGGPALEDLKRLRDRLGLREWVIMTGRVSDLDLCRYLSTADVCLDPDPYTEWADQSTMNKIMEYMAFGKPIVAFDLKETRFSAQEAAVYAHPNDVEEFANLINELLCDEPRRIRMGEAGRRRVEEFLSWEHSVPFLLSAYASLFRINSL